MKKGIKGTFNISGSAKTSTCLEISPHSPDTKNRNRRTIYDLTEEKYIQLLEKVRWKDGGVLSTL